MDSIPIGGVTGLIALIIFNAVTEAMVTAFENLSDAAVEKRLEEGGKTVKQVQYLLNHHRRYITVTDLLRLLSVFGMAVLYVTCFLPHIKTVLHDSFGEKSYVVTAVILLVAALLFIMLIELFSVKFPKKLAFKRAERTAFVLSGWLYLFVKLFGPVAWVIETATMGILKMFHIKASELEELVTEEELISTVAEAQESGVLEADEVKMIHNIFEFDDKEVKDIMTHRKNMIAVDADWILDKAMKFMLNAAYSRFPVYEESVENITGIVHLKDVLKVFVSGSAEKMKQRKVRSITRKPYFVPDTQSIDVLFHNMQTKKIHMAFAIDEYGQTAGLITLEDILEEIVGDIQDEYDSEEEDIIAETESVYLVKGVTSLEDLSEVLEMDMTDEECDTVNGLMVTELGYIPSENEQFSMEYKGCRFDIVEVKNKMIALARVTLLPKEVPEEKDEEQL